MDNIKKFNWKRLSYIGLAVLVVFALLFSGLQLSLEKSANNQVKVVITVGNPIDAYNGTPDYVGTSSTVVQQALDALPAAGGVVSLISPAYTFTGTVSRAINNVKIMGNNGTTITYAGACFSVGAQTGWVFEDIRIAVGGSITNFANAELRNVTIGATYYTLRAPNTTGNIAAPSITDSGLTAGRVPYAGTGGLLSDSDNFTVDGNGVPKVGGFSPFGILGADAYVISDNQPAIVKTFGNFLNWLGWPVYVCDYSEDNTEFNAATTAAGVGGTVKISSGNFIVSASIIPLGDQVLEGNNSKITCITNLNNHIIAVFNVNNVTVRGFIIDGNYANQSGTCNDILVYNSTGTTIENCIIKNAKTDGVFGWIGVVGLNVHDNYFDDNQYAAVQIAPGNTSSYKNHITNNTIFHDDGTSDFGITLSWSPNSEIANNVITGHANSLENINVGSSNGTVITGNVCNYSGDCGIIVYAHNAGDVLRGVSITGNTVGYSDLSGIFVMKYNGSTYEISVTGNVVKNCNVGLSDYGGIGINGSYCTVTGNITFDDQGSRTQDYGIREGFGETCSPDYNMVTGNTAYNNVIANYSRVGAHSTFAHNIPDTTSYFAESEMQTASTYSLKVSGDTDDYLTFRTVSNVPSIYGTGAYVRIGDAGTTSHSLASEDDLLASGKLEVDGVAYFDSAVTASSTITSAKLISASNNGTANTGVTAVEYGDGYNHTSVLTISKTDALTFADNANLGDGYLLYTLPAGAVVVDYCYMSVAITSAANEQKTDTPDVGLGTVEASGAIATLDGTATFENLITGQTTTNCNGTAVVKTTLPTAGTPFIVATGDAHTIYFNVADGWADIAGADLTADISGTVVIVWKFLA